MPRKQQGWITFQSSEEERIILEQHCQQQRRSKTEVLRELLRSLNQRSPVLKPSTGQRTEEHSGIVGIEIVSPSQDKKMKFSARNMFKGTIKQVVIGAVNTEVTLEIAPGIEITSIITRASAEELGLAEGKEAYAIIKSSNVMIGVD